MDPQKEWATLPGLEPLEDPAQDTMTPDPAVAAEWAAAPGLQPMQEVTASRGAAVDNRVSAFGVEFESAPLRTVANFGRGFNAMLADAAGWPVEAADAVMKRLGAKGFLENPGDAQNAVRETAKELGLTYAGDAETLSERIGEATFQQGVAAGIMYLTAPYFAAQQVSGVAGNTVRSMAQEVLKRPGAVALGEAGAVVGSETAAELAPEGYENLARLPGAIAGGVIGTGIATAGRKSPVAGSKTKVLGRRRFAGLQKEAVPDGTVPVGGKTQTPNYSSISDAIAGDQRRAEKLLDDAVKSIEILGARPDTPRAAERAQKVLTAAFKRARASERTYWSAVDTSRPVQMRDIKVQTHEMVREAAKSTAADVLPGDIIQKIRRFGPATTMKELLAVRSLAMSRARELTLTGGKTPEDVMVRSLNRISAIIDDGITKQYPNDKAWQEARAFSSWLHDRFTRGPVARFARPRADNLAFEAPEQAAGTLMRDSRSGGEIANIGRTVGSAAPDETASQIARETFREIAEADPKLGLKWLEKPQNERFFRAFPKLKAEVDNTRAALSTALDDMQTIQRSAFIKAVDSEGPQVAVERLFTGANKVSQARDIMRRMHNNPDATEGLRNAAIAHLIKQADANPKRTLDFLNSKDNLAMLGEILPSDRLGRLQRIITTAARLQAGEGFGSSKAYSQTVGRGARIIGAALGRWGARVFGAGGTVQIPGQGAEGAYAMANSLLRDFHPSDLMALAVNDIRWERFLYSRLPENVNEWQRALRQLTGLATMKQTGGLVLPGDDNDAE